MIPWLNTPDDFPPVHTALAEPNGLLAAGGALSPEWLLQAYPMGVFPWFSPGDPILWWSPTPRMVVTPGTQRITRSLRKTLRAGRFEVRCDTDFASVIAACAGPRHYADGTWIVPAIQQAYIQLHQLGWAHSVETWLDGELVGGLYGVAIGRAFFGESMFHRKTDASKVAFAHLVHVLEREKYAILDCQMSTSHLASLGAHEISREAFTEGLQRWTRESVHPGRWPSDFASHSWNDVCPN